jgi:hypothetical protein
MQNCQLKIHLRDAIVSVSLLFICKIKIAIPYFTLSERKHLNVKRRKKDSSLSGIELLTRYTFSISKAVTVVSECIYVTRKFRSSPTRNRMLAVWKCLTFIRRSTSYDRTA